MSKSTPELDDKERTDIKGQYIQLTDTEGATCAVVSNPATWKWHWTKIYTDKVWSIEDNSQNLRLVQSLQSRVSVCMRLYAGVYSKHRGLASWLLEEELRRKKDPHILRRQAASELELERRNILSSMRYSNPERGGPWFVTMSIMNPSQSPDQQKSMIIDVIKSDWKCVVFIIQSVSTNVHLIQDINAMYTSYTCEPTVWLQQLL